MLTVCVILAIIKLCRDQYLEDKLDATIEDYERQFYESS